MYIFEHFINIRQYNKLYNNNNNNNNTCAIIFLYLVKVTKLCNNRQCTSNINIKQVWVHVHHSISME